MLLQIIWSNKVLTIDETVIVYKYLDHLYNKGESF